MTDDSAPPPGDASDPTLAILWGPPPAYTGNTGGSAATSSAPVPDAAPMLVNLATVQAAEQGALSSASRVADTYNALDQQVQAAIAGGTYLGQKATYSYIYDPRSANGHDVTLHYADTGLQQGAQQFAEQINPAMRRVLRMIADGTESVGVYIALLDKAGQAYTAADKSSLAPPAPSGG
ncbi:MAG TPA: hypothetical protein VGI74_26155 [Streptosporangiaceae bacterium]